MTRQTLLDINGAIDALRNGAVFSTDALINLLSAALPYVEAASQPADVAELASVTAERENFGVEIAHLRSQLDSVEDGSLILDHQDHIAALQAQLATKNAALEAEIARLRPHYQSMTATDQARRQMLDHFERFARALTKEQK